MTGKSAKKKPRKLVQSGDIMKMFTIGKTRYRQLKADPDWPEPVEVASGGEIYDIADILAYAEAHGRPVTPLE
jgi:hypothetical protein